MNYETGLALANELVSILRPYSERIEIAGGIRRHKTEPHDIEIVLAPRFEVATYKTLDGQNEYDLDLTDNQIGKLISSGILEHGDPDRAGKKAPCGPKYYRLKYKGEKLDIFSVIPPAQWGLVYLIRTGDADFSHAFVTRLWKFGLKSVDGCIVNAETLETAYTPEETDAFTACRMQYIEPEKRTRGAVPQ